jgi:pyridoxal 5'-phosphate synthase pdxT subunit
MVKGLRIGVLAIQGDFAAHASMLARLGVETIEVRRSDQLADIDGLIIPGGESTTMLKAMREEQMIAPIKDFARAGKTIFGTCAGAILLARQVHNPPQESLGLIDITVERNSYGRQIDSFIGQAETALGEKPFEAVFIRAPRIIRTGPGVEALSTIEGEPVLVKQDNLLAATFHPELTADERVHSFFIEMSSLISTAVTG